MIFVAVFTVFVVNVVHVFAKDSCPQGWVPFNGKCYYISTTKADYQTSLTQCYSKGSRLAIVKSVDEHKFLATYVKIRGAPIFLDGNDIRKEGEWISSYNNEKLVFTYWNSGEPGGKTRENCLIIYNDLKWHDVSCSSTFYYSCEKEMLDPFKKSCLSAKDLLDEVIKCKQQCK